MLARRRRVAVVRSFAFALLGLAVLWVPSARGIDVTTTADNGDNNNPPAGSLRAAVINSNGLAGPDVIDATGVSGSIDLEAALPVLIDDVEIRGPGATALTVRRGVGASFRILHVAGGAAVEMSAFTVANGRNTGSSDGGGGIANVFSSLTLRDMVVSGNENAGTSNGADGGGIFALGGTAATTLIDSTVSGNSATGDGGGLFNSGVMTIANSAVVGNTAQGGAGCVGGGGIQSRGFLAVVNSTISGNSHPEANDGGGGILVCSSNSTIVGSTIARNTGPTGANLVVSRAGATATVRSTIIADPVGGANCVARQGGTLGSQGYNLADDGSCPSGGPGDQPGTDAVLGPLAGNGGLTLTHALMPGSPAIDRGASDGRSTDQRGLPRAVDFPEVPNAPGGDGADVGAFEVQELEFEPPPNQFTIVKAKKNKRKGIAKLVVEIPGPGDLELAKNKKVKPAAKQPGSGGKTKLKVKPRGKAKRRLSKRRLRRGGKPKLKARVKAEVTYAPSGGTSRTKQRKLKLVRKGKRGR